MSFSAMFTIGFDLFVIAFLVVGLLFFVAVWLYYDRRDRLFYDAQRLRRIHHCVKCGALYASRDNRETVECPQCGFRNTSLRF